jgi:hypothetical protein
MRFFGRKSAPTRHPNILVYCVVRIDENGQARTKPIGLMPRLSDESEAAFRTKLDPNTGDFVPGEINGVAVVVAWKEPGVVAAVSVVAAEDASELPGFETLSTKALEKFDDVFTHFPRS